MGELIRWSLMDDALLEAASNGLSGTQIEADLDIPAAQAIVRIKQLLRDRDVWSEVERKQLHLESLYRLKAKVESVLDPTDPKHIDSLSRILDLLGKRLDTAMRFSNEELDKVTEVQARKLLQLYLLATERAKDILSEQYPDAIMEDIDMALQEGLRDAAAEIES